MEKEDENTATKKLKKARKNCCIEGCMETPYHMVPGARYHEFPSNIEMFEKWLINVREGLAINNVDAGSWMPMEKSVVCGQHFLPEDYRDGTTRLFRTATPSVFPVYDFQRCRRFCKH
ncbi:hypothetical protein B566_EDAN017242 [Ephemera danica]|nr:hypothetical protein B566_EDAN017242 [Ephemera danica]